MIFIRGHRPDTKIEVKVQDKEYDRRKRTAGTQTISTAQDDTEKLERLLAVNDLAVKRRSDEEIQMRSTFILSVAGGLFIGWVCSQGSTWQMAQSQESKAPQAAEASSDLDALKVVAKAFEDAFNKGDAAAIAAQFTENAEVVDEDGEVVTGRDQIKLRFTKLFEEHPKAQIALTVGSLRQLSPDVAVEDGFSLTTLDPDEPGSRNPYAVVHLKRNGKWLMASVRDFPEEETLDPHSQLQQLEWLVGEWVDESEESRVETSCQWAEDGNYLLQDYVIKLKGGMQAKGTQRIGWDPLRNTIRSWSFDHSGGFGEAFWTPIERGWVIKATGVTPDGQSASATRIVSVLGNDLFQMDSSNRLVGSELLPDVSVRVVRKPPPPSK